MPKNTRTSIDSNATHRSKNARALKKEYREGRSFQLGIRSTPRHSAASRRDLIMWGSTAMLPVQSMKNSIGESERNTRTSPK